MTNYSTFNNEFSVDYKQGWEDGIQTNCYFKSNNRDGEYLDAYKQGFFEAVEATESIEY